MAFNFIRPTSLSGKVLMVLAFILVLFRCIDPPDHQLGWDVFGYYLYLPSFFIYNDPALLDHAWLDALMQKYEPSSTLYQLINMENGARVIKYSMGTAILLFPFFALANMLSALFGFPLDGLSLPYQLTISAGGMVYALVGLVYFREVLLEFFSDKISALMLVLIVFGTNYFQLISFDGTLLTHNFLFTLYAVLIYYTIKWHKEYKIRSAMIIGLCLGLIILVRPSELPAILIPLFWGVFNWNSFKEKIVLIGKNKKQISIALGITLLVGVPQLFYWKFVSGSWLFYSYQNAGEGFEFLSPYTLQFLFSFRKGWFIYTPIMLLAVFGILKLRTQQKEISMVVILCAISSLWIMSSWTTWWYAGGSFSSRSMVSLYPLLAIPMGVAIIDIRERSKFSKRILTIVLALLVLLNLFQTWQWRKGIIDRERMTTAYYFAIFGRMNAPENKDELLLVKRSTGSYEEYIDSSNYSTKHLYLENFVTKNMPYGHPLNADSPYSPSLTIRFQDLTVHNHVWLDVSAIVEIPSASKGASPNIVAAMHHEGEAYKYMNITATDEVLQKGGRIELKLIYLTPEVRSQEDVLKIYVWQPDAQTIFLRSMEIKMREPKDPVK